VWNPESGSFCVTGRNWKYTRRFLCGLLATFAGSLDPWDMGVLSLSVDQWRHISAKPSCFDRHCEGALSHSNHTFACAHKFTLDLQCRQMHECKRATDFFPKSYKSFVLGLNKTRWENSIDIPSVCVCIIVLASPCVFCTLDLGLLLHYAPPLMILSVLSKCARG